MRKLSKSSVDILKSGRMRTVLTIAVAALMFGVLLTVNLLTPPIGDDYDYGYLLTFRDDIVSGTRRYIAYAYSTYTGRVFTALSYVAFFNLLNKTSIALVNSSAYMLTVWLLHLIIRGKRENSICLFVGINLSLWVFVPELGQDIFWTSGVVNYLLPMLPILGMMLIYRRSYDSSSVNDGTLKCVLTALLGVISGWQLENSSITVPVVILAYICLWKLKGSKVPKWAWSGLAGSVLGYILLVVAPGNFHRADLETQSVSLLLPFKFAVITYYWIMFAGVLTAVFVFGIIKCRKSSPGAIREGSVFFAAALVSAYCMIAAPSSPERTWFITVSLMTAAAGIVMQDAFAPEEVSREARIVFCAAALIILGTMAADTILATYDIHQQFVQREERIMTAKQNGKTVISVPVYKLKYPLKANRYALYGLYDVEPGRNSPNSFNESVARYYGVEAIIGTTGE